MTIDIRCNNRNYHGMEESSCMSQDSVGETNVHSKVSLHAYLQFRWFLHFLDSLADMFVCMTDNAPVANSLHI